MRIYTKSGDQGRTSLYDGTRVVKHDGRIELLGDLDELNAHVGWLISIMQANKQLLKSPTTEELKSITPLLQKVQSRLFDIGSEVADPNATAQKRQDYQPDTTELEQTIDRLADQLPVLGNFILPGGSYVASVCHLCRTITRRTERRFWEVSGTPPFNESIGPYLNRLSDVFFMLARFLNKSLGREDVVWENSTPTI